MTKISAYFKFKLIDIYIMIWVLFHIMSYMGIKGAGILLVIMHAWAIVEIIKLHQRPVTSRTLRVFDLFTAMIIIYGVFFWKFGAHYLGIENRTYLLKVLRSLLPFYPLYRAALKGTLTKEKILFWIIPFFFVAYLDYQSELQKRLEIFFNKEDIGVTNNASYLILGLVPLIGLVKKRMIQVAMLLFCFFFIISSFKRGAILIFFVCLMYYVYANFRLSSKNMLLTIILSLIAYYFITNQIENLLENSVQFNAKIEATLEGDSSNRDMIYTKLWACFVQSDLINMLFGHGVYGSYGLIGWLAHNDWLEILTDQGIFGVSIQYMFCWNIIKVWQRSEKGSEACLSLGLFSIIYLMTGLFSMAFDRIPVYEMAIFGYFTAVQDRQLSSIKKNI